MENVDSGKSKSWVILGASCVVAVALTLFQVLTASPLWILSGYAQAGIHWGLLSTFILFSYPSKFKGGWVIDLFFMVLSWVCVYTLFTMNDALVNRAGIFSKFETYISIAQVVLTLIIGVRVLGTSLPLICGVLLLYTLFGSNLGGMFRIARISLNRLATNLMVGSEGLFGISLVTCSRFIFLFVLFGAILEISGAGEFFVDLAFSAMGKVRGGPAQAAVYSSMLMGMVNGSGAANVVTTGTFTIPLMKKIGFDNDTAGAVEAVASNGGQIMPPVMGAVAFLVSEATGIEYAAIAIAAFIPAVLYYTTLSSSVLVYSYRNNIPCAPSTGKTIATVIKSGWYYFIPLALLTVLLIRGYSPQRSALWSIAAMLVIGVFTQSARFTKKAMLELFTKTAASMCSVSTACLLAGIVTGCINITGIGLRISGIVRTLSGGSSLIMLVLTMIVCLILGMGLPTSAAYIVLAVLVAPALINLGITQLAAHLFILYFGTIATLTPPVALAVFAACSISGGTLWRTGGQSMKLAAAGFLIPFIFVYNNELLLMGQPLDIAFAVATAFIGCILLSAALFGWAFENLSWLKRGLILAASFGLILPRPLWGNAAGAVLAAVVLAHSYNTASRAK